MQSSFALNFKKKYDGSDNLTYLTHYNVSKKYDSQNINHNAFLRKNKSEHTNYVLVIIITNTEIKNTFY